MTSKRNKLEARKKLARGIKYLIDYRKRQLKECNTNDEKDRFRAILLGWYYGAHDFSLDDEFISGMDKIDKKLIKHFDWLERRYPKK